MCLLPSPRREDNLHSIISKIADSADNIPESGLVSYKLV